MNNFSKTICKNKTNKIVDKLYKHNYSFDDHQVKHLFKKIFHKHTNLNIKNNSNKEECLICYDTKKKKYKIPCCNKQYVCVNCLENIYNIKSFKCLFCRKNLFRDELIKIFSEIRKEKEYKINSICSFLHKNNALNYVKNIVTVSETQFQIIYYNKDVRDIYHDDNDQIYWLTPDKGIIQLL